MSGARYLAAWASGEQVNAVDHVIEAYLGESAWTRAVRAGCLTVWTRRDRSLPVTEFSPGLVVIGQVFGRPALPTPQADRFEWLVENAWGSYVAICAGRGGAPEVLRDPSGARDALTWRLGDATLLADDVAGLPPQLWPKDLALDWTAVLDFVRRPLSAADRCGLTGLSSITPGAAQPMGGGPQRTLWRPATFLNQPPQARPQERLYETVMTSVRAMAEVAGPLMVETSGGLDSSIVAACVGKAAQTGQAEVRLAVNQFVADREGDERAWAQAVCQASGLPLVYVEKPIGQLLESDLTDLAGGARPAMDALDPIRDRMLLELARNHGVRSLMTGQGGDAVFFQMPTSLVVADLMADRGPGAALDRRVFETAHWLRRSVWSVLFEAQTRAPMPGANASARFWGPRLRDAPPVQAEHPWLAPPGRRPAKALQVRHIALCQLKFGRSWRGNHLNVLHPLLTQPVVELSLSIPSWRHVEGGRDRGLARAAFAKHLPKSVTQRRSKGLLARLYNQRVAASLDVLRPWLLDGALAAAGVIDRAAVEQALTPEDLIWTGDGFRLFQVAMVEGWVRHWSRPPRSRPLSA